MFIIVQAPDYSQHACLLNQMHRLRKRVFADTLQWDVEVADELERDCYDDIGPVYVLWCSDNRQMLLGSMRLMPTTGPTLLHDVFARTIPAGVALQGAGIWEATRCCIDSEVFARYHPSMDQARAFGMICLAAAEVANSHGIHTLISNYEPHMKRIYSRCGAEIKELGRADGYGRRPVCCGAFAISNRIVQSMRAALSLERSLLDHADAEADTYARLVA